MTEHTVLHHALYARAAQWMHCGEYAEAVFALRRCLADAECVWPDDRCDAMLLLAQCCLHMHDRSEAERWLLRACGETPHRPRPWLQAAAFYETTDPQTAAAFAARAMHESVRSDI